MRPPFVAVAVFCDSIRQEVGGAETLVGVMTDNVNVPEVPAAMGRLALYVRIQIDPDFDPNPVSLALRLPDDTEVDLGKVDATVFDRARQQAREQGKPYAGVIVRSVMGPFGILKYGRIEAILRTSTDKILCGHLTFRAPDSSAIAVSTSTAPSPPAKRSRADGKKKATKRAPSRPSRRRASAKRQR
jgi:hypothetical protein